MALLMTKDSKLRVIFEIGTSEEGKPIFKTKSYANVVEGATPDQLYQAAQALASLSNYPMSNVQQSELHEIL
ncbi:DUF1659 domain-containing protein [Niallia sp. Krafla_26]|uniref:DUF1659 domain-containing protein n=1 Tax=Niallia sp. Krafla_26 TaxID=3064703 RepID=UPI003D17979B